MSGKRKRVVLTLTDKVKIIESLEKGVSGAVLAKKYGIGISTMSYIKKNSSTILQFASNLDKKACGKSRKTMKLAVNNDLDTAVYKWFAECRGQGQRITGPMICEKALELNAQMARPNDFKATSGWLNRFKCRHGIRNFEIYGEKQLADNTIAEQVFKEKLKDIITRESYDLSDIYTAEEFNLFWKVLPNKSKINQEFNQEQLTVIVCTNATGTHKLPLLLIGKEDVFFNPTETTNLPIAYRNETSILSYNDLFIVWYETFFIPEVKKHHRQHGKIQLLIDYDSFRIEDKELSFEKEDGAFKLLQFPPNINTSKIQPLKQGVLKDFKMSYRKRFLETLLNENTEPLTEKYRKFNLKDCALILGNTWKSVSENILLKSWQNLMENFDIKQETKEEINQEHFSWCILDMLKCVPEFQKCNYKHINIWLDTENTDVVKQDSTVNDTIIPNQNTVALEVNMMIKEENCESSDEFEKCPTHEEAFHSLEITLNWLKHQEESEMQQLLMLQSLRDLAAKKCGIVVAQNAGD